MPHFSTPLELTEFLAALADAIATATGIARPADPALSCGLFVHASDDARAPRVNGEITTYSVIRCWDGEPASDRPNELQLQVTSNAPTAADAIAEASRIHAALRNADGHGKFAWAISPRYLVNRITNLQPPKLLGDDGRRRFDAVFNFSASYCVDAEANPG